MGELTAAIKAGEDEILLLKDECEGRQTDLDSLIFRIDRVLQTGAASQFITFSDGSDSPEDEERAYALGLIQEHQAEISKSRQKLRRQSLEKAAVLVQESDVDRTIEERRAMRDELESRMAAVTERCRKLRDRKAIPVNVVRGEDAVIDQIERAVDDIERSIVRSKVESIEYGLQREFSDYRALKAQNEEREKQLAKRRKEGEAARRKQERIARQIAKMRERMEKMQVRSESAVTIQSERSQDRLGEPISEPKRTRIDPAAIARSVARTSDTFSEARRSRRGTSAMSQSSRKSRSQRTPKSPRQIQAEKQAEEWQRRENAALEKIVELEQKDLEEEEIRAHREAEFTEAWETLKKLLVKLEERDRLEAQLSNTNDRIQGLRIQHRELAARLAKAGARTGAPPPPGELRKRAQDEEYRRNLEDRKARQEQRAVAIRERQAKLDRTKENLLTLDDEIVKIRASIVALDHQVGAANSEVDRAVKECLGISREVALVGGTSFLERGAVEIV
jgi:hypothetical protein